MERCNSTSNKFLDLFVADILLQLNINICTEIYITILLSKTVCGKKVILQAAVSLAYKLHKQFCSASTHFEAGNHKVQVSLFCPLGLFQENYIVYLHIFNKKQILICCTIFSCQKYFNSCSCFGLCFNHLLHKIEPVCVVQRWSGLVYQS